MQVEKTFPKISRLGRIVPLYFVVALFLCIVASAFYSVRLLRTLDTVKDNTIAVQGLSIANGAFVAITNLIYQFLAKDFTTWENWQFQVRCCLECMSGSVVS